ncbi:MAG: lipid A export permease/ATP-binding protein MsbA [Betaproteobacteria bacterium]|nr:lipid A export permease/ATP-binding protein MsbA [Betaproteobacteria bacterium]
MYLPPAVPTSYLFQRLFGYAKAYKWAYAVSVLGMAATAVTEAMLPAMMKYLLDQGFQVESAFQVVAIPLAIVGLFLAKGLLIYISNYAATWITTHVTMALRNDMFAKMLRLPATSFADPQGSFIAKVLYDVLNIGETISLVVISAFREALTVMALVAYLIYLDTRLALIALSIGPVIVGFVRVFSRRLREAGRSGLDSIGQLTQVLEESVTCQKIIKIYQGQGTEKRRFEAANARFRRAQMKEAIPASATTPLTHLAASVALALIVYLALRQVNQGESTSGVTSVGGFVAFITAMLMLLAPLKKLTEVNTSLQRGRVCAQSVFAFLDSPEEVDSGTVIWENPLGKIEFQNVSYAYPKAIVDSLEAINFCIEPGQTLAVVGASGSGKSTLAALLPRFMSPTQGQILIDGICAEQITLTSLRQHMSLVTQEVLLFNDTVAANIAYGQSNFNMADIEQAAKAANAWDFIKALPLGLHTNVGDGGMKLSGGQRQRISIARAIFKNAPLLILDEATSALDAESDRSVQIALANLMRGKTCVVIAHRLSTIQRADRIIVLSQGKLVEAGTHNELLSLNGMYASLCRLQFNESTSLNA